MTLRLTDGFDSYAASTDLLKKWQLATSATWSSSAGRNGGGALQLAAAGALLKSFTALSSTPMNTAFWFKSTAKPGATSGIVQPLTANSSALGTVAINTSGAFVLTNQVGTTVATGTLNVCDGNWHWVETRGDWQNASTTHACYVDGVQQYNGSFNTGSSNGTPSLFVFAGYSGTTITLDDLIVYDNSGSSPVNADFPLTAQQINTLRPNGDNAIQFTPDTGSTNYTQVNEVNGDTTHYVQDGTSGHQDLYSYDDMTFSPAKIWGVMCNGYLNNPGIGTINHNQLCSNQGNTTTGTTTATPITNARVVQEPFVLDPNTGAVWASSSNLNSALFGIKVT